jgi:anti-sigma factor RsiW
MSCLSPERIYSYLDGILPAEEARQAEDHLSSCAGCRAALEERRMLALATESLPPLELPPDFSARVITALSPGKVTLRSWLAALAFWLSSVVVTLGFFVLITGERGGGFLLSLVQAAWSGLKNASLLFARFATLVILAGRAVRYIVTFLVKGLVLVTSLISPGIQAAAIVLSLIILIGLWFLVGKGRLVGEKS